MSQIVGVKFRDHAPVEFFQTVPYVLVPGDHVLVQSEEGLLMGVASMVTDTPPRGVDPAVLKTIFRKATDDDIRIQAENERTAKEAFAYCRERIREMDLDMKLVDVDVYFDRGKMIFSFTAPGRIDFRELVKDLVRTYRTRIELRQIGVRHETQMLGGIGNCGQVCCCRQFMRNFEPVTIKMAKDQNLFLNPAKISGVCGRLLCCLVFEKQNYAEFQARLPKIGRKFTTPTGRVKTLRGNMFRDTVSVLTEDNKELEIPLQEWQGFLEGEPITGAPEVSAPGPEVLSAEQEAEVYFPQVAENNASAHERQRQTDTQPDQREKQGMSRSSRKPSAPKKGGGRPKRPSQSGQPGQLKKSTPDAGPSEGRARPKKKRKKKKHPAKARPQGQVAKTQKSS